MMDPLQNLDSRLTSSFETVSSRMGEWLSADSFGPTLRSIKQAFDSPAVLADRETISAAVRRFRNTREIRTFKHLRYICAGATLKLEDWHLISDHTLWEILSIRAQEGKIRRRIKCYQALLRSYWSFPAQNTAASTAEYRGWLKLREWLNGTFDPAHAALKSEPRARIPQWFRTLEEHRNLLSEDPCGRYAPSLLSGDNTLLNDAAEGLAIPTESWVFDEAVFAQIRHATEGKEADFLSKLPAVLDIFFSPGASKVSRTLATRCTACLVSRYAQCPSALEHIRLRDACLELIGNPWLRRAAWDANVRMPNGEPDDSAREMVHAWLRTRLIKDFFELLSEERAADQRRLNYWLRYEGFISDMWFILGNNAFSSNEPDFVDFRKRARGRILSLAGQTPPANNAFVMMIGDHAVIEFGLKGNACFMFSWPDLPLEVRKKLTSGIQGLEIEIGSLRHEKRLKRLVHIDSPSSLISWEEKFDEELLPILDATPSSPPNSLRSGRRPSAPLNPYATKPSQVQGVGNWTIHSSPAKPASRSLFSWSDLEKHVAKHHLKVIDHRRKGGSYWVLTGNAVPEVADPLRTWGFRYKPGKGWWRE